MQYQDYLDYYGFNPQLRTIYRRSYLSLAENAICCHYFYPPKFKAVIVLIHGYLDHTGNLRNLINRLFAEGYAVAAFDLPGHGLSEGERGVIADFKEYVSCFELFLDTLNIDDSSIPKSVIAHSTGCTILIEYLKGVMNNPFKKIVLAAPLIRSAHWNWTLFGLHFVKFFEKNGFLKRKFRANSSDREYLKFRANDPLQPHQVSLQWLRALISWNQSVLTYHSFEFPVSIIQGDQDITVEWRYNLPVVKRLFPLHDLKIIQGANHQLFNESDQLLKQVFTVIDGFLTE